MQFACFGGLFEVEFFQQMCEFVKTNQFIVMEGYFEQEVVPRRKVVEPTLLTAEANEDQEFDTWCCTSQTSSCEVRNGVQCSVGVATPYHFHSQFQSLNCHSTIVKEQFHIQMEQFMQSLQTNSDDDEMKEEHTDFEMS